MTVLLKSRSVAGMHKQFLHVSAQGKELSERSLKKMQEHYAVPEIIFADVQAIALEWLQPFTSLVSITMNLCSVVEIPARTELQCVRSLLVCVSTNPWRSVGT